MPSKRQVFTTHVETVSSPLTAEERLSGGDAGHCPRVRNDYFTYRLSP